VSDRISVTVREQEPVAFQTHKIGAHLLFDGHGLSPYHGLVSCFEPDHEDTLDTFEAAGDSWEVVGSDFWDGKLADPDDGYALNEYQYQLAAEDDAGDRDLTLQFRPAFPDARHVDTGEPIQSLPNELPEGIRVQIISTNLERYEMLDVLQGLADHITLNPDYFAGEPHDWSRVTALETYVRLDRDEMEQHVTASGGVIDELAQVASDQSGRGEYKWNHEEVTGHYQAVALDSATWRTLIEDQRFGKRLKSYHPEYPRSEDDGDPLYHPKLEVQFSPTYDDEGNVPWDAYPMLREELRQTGLNALHWSGLPVSPTDRDATETFVADAYFEPAVDDEPVTLHSNPLPELVETTETHVEAEFARTNLGDAEREVLQALTDGGDRHYEDLADEAGASSSTVYRLVSKLASLVDADNGVISFADQVTREHVSSILKNVRETAEWASRSIRDLAGERDLLEDGDGPFAQWMERHGVRLVEQHPELHFEFGRALSKYEVVQLLRAGYEAVRGSGVETSRFLDSRVSWRTPDGESNQRRSAFDSRFGKQTVLGGFPLRA